MNKQTHHLLLRYSDNQAPPPGTIKLHEEVIKKYGSVWLGKFGRRIGDNVVNLLKKQIEAKKPTYVFLTQSKGKHKYLVHIGIVENIERNVDNRDLIPQYYGDNSNRVTTWFKISKFIELNPKVLTVLIGTSGVPIFRTMAESIAAMFSVRFKQDEKFEDYLLEEPS